MGDGKVLIKYLLARDTEPLLGKAVYESIRYLFLYSFFVFNFKFTL